MVALAERQAEQARLHAADPYSVPLFLPVDDPEFGTEAFTAVWEDEKAAKARTRRGPLSRPRIGPTMRRLHDTASACPGLSQAALLRACGLPECGMGYRRPVLRAEAAGLLLVCRSGPGRPSKIFASRRDLELYDMRQRLMSASSADEAEQLRAAIEEIRAAQAQTWAL